ncbi:hypothetical protein EV424DRAFT_1421057 [Suillus variegatus]|nr:hypothetical protein EV424DRAFT_1421057 [Suillus variegatus]
MWNKYRIANSGPHTDSVTYPPAVRAVEREIVSSQPSSSSMLLHSSPQDRPLQKDEQTHSPLRLRGGCIPCPGGICCILPCPCCC